MAAHARPDYLDLNVAAIPEELKDRDCWVAWRPVWVVDRWTKKPVDCNTGEPGSSTNPATWTTFTAALAYADKHGLPGIGYVFSADDPYCGIDIDKCRDPANGTLTTLAATIVAELDGYVEVSPSGTGVKIWVRGLLPGNKGYKSVKKRVEMYDQGRYFTVTGHRLTESQITIPERAEALAHIHAKLFPISAVTTAPSARPALQPPPPDDQLLIDRAHRAKNGPAFARLWSGDTSGHNDDDSSADLALCNHLAFWVGPDPSRIDRLFRASRLYRTKWERPDYRDATITKALDGRSDYYDWAERGDSGASFRLVGADESPEDEGGAPSTNANDYDLSDTGNANFFTALNAGELRYDHRRKAWFRWAGHWWAQDTDGYPLRLTEEMVRLRSRAAALIEDENARKLARKWSLTSQSKEKRKSCLDLAASNQPITLSGAAWDNDPYLFGVANGVVDLLTGTLHPGSPLDQISLHSPAIFDAAATCPRWEQFLAEVFGNDREIIDWMQRIIGYSLTGSIEEHAAFFCFGTGSNGKSTLLNILAYLLGDYAGTTSFATLEANDRQGGSSEIAALSGKRLVAASETSEGKQLNEGRLKALTGGDPIQARFLYANPFSFRPLLKLWVAVNHKPTVRDDSIGFWRRVKLIDFKASFRGKGADKHLEATLQGEASGILNWAIAGCRDWRAGGLRTPESIDAATREYQQESDPLALFVDEACVIGEMQVVQSNVLYLAYLEWTSEQGLREREVLSNNMFGRRLGERFEREHGKHGKRYRGIGISMGWQDRPKGATFKPR